MVKCGINGFGRIGRISLRASLLKDSGVEIVQINDPFTPLDLMETLMNYDSAQGRFIHLAEADLKNNHLLIKERETGKILSSIFVTSEKSPDQIPWGKTSVEVVLDCTGVFLTKELSKGHLNSFNSSSSAKKVVLSAPAKDKEIPLYVVGVNSDSYKNEEIISNASCTTNCLAPIIKVLNDKFGLEKGLMTTVHACTQNQLIVDGCNKRSVRTGFSGMSNIIPATTGAAGAVGKVIPEVKGILTGMALRVPTLTGSVVDVVVSLKDKNSSLDDVIDALKNSANGNMKNILKVDYSDAMTSAAIIGDSHSSIVDVKACMEIKDEKNERLIKIISWYDNEFGYSCRLVQLAKIVGEKK